jgi:hypothetical protein
MDNYVLHSYFYVIYMDEVDIVLGYLLSTILVIEMMS